MQEGENLCIWYSLGSSIQRISMEKQVCNQLKIIFSYKNELELLRCSAFRRPELASLRPLHVMGEFRRKRMGGHLDCLV